MKTMKGNPITVLGRILKVGDKPESFKALDNASSWKSIEDYKKPYVLVSVVPSLDTSVCSLQTRTINERLASYDKLDILTISVDLPFAQKRCCGQDGLNITTLSDHFALDFGFKYGVVIEEKRLLARALFILNQAREVIYVEYLDEMSKHPDYDKVFEFIETLH